MRAKINGIEIEGSVDEIKKLIKDFNRQEYYTIPSKDLSYEIKRPYVVDIPDWNPTGSPLPFNKYEFTCDIYY